MRNRCVPALGLEDVVVVNSGWRGGLMNMSPRHYLHLLGEQTTFEAMAAKTLIGAALNRTGGVDRVVGARVTGGYFDVFGVQPALGRVVVEAAHRDVDEPGAARFEPVGDLVRQLLAACEATRLVDDEHVGQSGFGLHVPACYVAGRRTACACE